ncbi:MAG: SPOR domain-containing protein [Alphaproteobacteria bacterium]|nr:SPOR domain-containing protein [Alphaproteobacteria bacterium]
MPITTPDARPSRAPRKTHPMTPRLGVVLLPLFVAACGLPPAVTVASFAIDAISLAVSEKTIADHALSQIAQKDCAIWRRLMGDQLCIDEDSAVAAADLGAIITASGPTGDESMDVAVPGAESGLRGPAESQLADFTTASAPAEETAPPSGLDQPATAVAAAETPGAPGTVDHVRPAATADRPASRREWVSAAIAGPGLYYVIGSFSRWTNAERLTARHSAIAPSIITTMLNGRRLFRVVIGPFRRDEQKGVRARLRRAGIYNLWGIRMDPAEWFVAKSAGTARNRVRSIAQLTTPLAF